MAHDWIDPYVGVRARYQWSPAWYLTAKADVGGFGVGSSFAWEVYGALGCQLTRRVFAEAGYRYLYTDYHHNGFIYNVTTSGAQVTFGVVF